MISNDYNIGELVNFSSKSIALAHANDRYTNPGIVIDISRRVVFQSDYTTYTVLWACGNVTQESCGYLEKVNDSSCSLQS